MSEENAERFEGGTPFEMRVLRGLAGLNNRLNTLEAKVDGRLQETRPVWEAVLLRLDTIESRLGKMEAELDVFGRDLVEARTDVELLKRRPPAA